MSSSTESSTESSTADVEPVGSGAAVDSIRLGTDLTGVELGTRTVAYDERDVMLYALAVGAPADRLDLVYERDLRVLPTFGLTLGLWAPDLLGVLGGYVPRTALHGSQRLSMHAPLPPSGELELSGRVAAAWDKGSAAVLEVVVECEQFTATYGIYAPGCGGFGGDRGPSSAAAPPGEPDVVATVPTRPDQAALYRLTGDRHVIHIDPVAARAIGLPGTIMHGLCTLGMAALAVADAVGRHPAELSELAGRFAAPVRPGQDLTVHSWVDGQGRGFEVAADEVVALSAGRVAFTQ